MSESTHLFVGGPIDGQRKIVDDKHSFLEVAERMKPSYLHTPNAKPPEADDIAAITHLYQKRYFGEENMTQRTAFFHSSVHHSKSMASLIEGYHQPVDINLTQSEEESGMLETVIHAITSSGAIRAATTNEEGVSVIFWEADAIARIQKKFIPLAESVIATVSKLPVYHKCVHFSILDGQAKGLSKEQNTTKLITLIARIILNIPDESKA